MSSDTNTSNLTELIARETELFRQEVFDFLAEFEIGETYFGLKAARNPRLVSRLRDGKGVHMQTIESVRSFMAAHREAKSSGSEARA